MLLPEINLKLPNWLQSLFNKIQNNTFTTIEKRMEIAIQIADLNIKHKTGGPFGACIFDLNTNKILSLGANIVTNNNCSVAHAEIMAIMTAQKIFSNYDLGNKKENQYELVTSVEPCTMCLGATYWSGVRQLVYGATDEDARAIGFDEGVKPKNWEKTLETRGIKVIPHILRNKANKVLQEYAISGHIYNARKGNIH
jgi:tRNA(Arg) A34 adenosine deaminase TadA